MIVVYARVSTTDQTTAHQVTQAKAAGFKVDKVLSDEGVSGVSTRLAERPEGRRLFDMLRSGATLVVRWVDRLGRNYTDVVDTIREFMRRGVIIRTVINGMVFDGSTTDPMQQAVRDALIAFMAATAQAQAEVTKSAQRAGIDHARRVKLELAGGRACGLSWPQAASVLYSIARSRRALGPSPRPRASASRRPFALSRTRWPQRPRWLHGACDGRKRALRDARPRFCAAFLSLCLSILNLKLCRTDLKRPSKRPPRPETERSGARGTEGEGDLSLQCAGPITRECCCRFADAWVPSERGAP
jgi:putative DNA-invertase from lambdoid prophage Rac